MSHFVDAILSMSGPLVYLIIGALAFGEAAAFIGLVLPGETALIIGGVLASQGNIHLGIMLAVAITAAVAGDSVGFEIGRKLGPGLKTSRAGKFVGAERWAKGEAFLTARGGSAVLLGRWVGLLRALVPALAGMAGMPYRTFILYNAIGGTLWSTAMVLLGFFAGHSYRTVEQYLGKATLILTGVIAGLVLITLLARFALRHRQWTEDRVHRLIPSRTAALVLRGLQPAAAGLRSRHGLLAVGAAALIAVFLTAGYTLIARVPPVAAILRSVNEPVLAWFVDHQDSEFTLLVGFFGVLSHPASLAVALGAASLALPRSGLRGAYGPALAATVGAVVIITASHLALLSVPLPPAHASQLGISLTSPAGAVLVSTAMLTTAAWFLGRHHPSWNRSVVLIALLLSATALLVLSHLYPAHQQPSDILIAWAAGTFWALTFSALWTTAQLHRLARAVPPAG